MTEDDRRLLAEYSPRHVADLMDAMGVKQKLYAPHNGGIGLIMLSDYVRKLGAIIDELKDNRHD